MRVLYGGRVPGLYQIGLLLVVAAVIAIACERVRVPYTVGLVLAGLSLAVAPVAINIPLSKTLIYTVLLPPLVFEAALRLDWRKLRADLPVITALAVPGLVIAAAVTATGMHWLVGWGWAGAVLFGILIAASDPVSVISTFDEVGVDGRIDLLVRAESLSNDGMAAVAFGLAIAFMRGASADMGSVSLDVLRTIGGGLACGWAVAVGLLIVAGRTSNPLVEITLTTLAAYGSFLLAERFGGSGVLASLAAGLVIGGGGVGRFGSITVAGQEAVKAFWEYAAFLTNSLIFILIGVREAHQDFTTIIWPGLAAVILVLFARAATVYPVCRLFARPRHAVSVVHQHVLFWGGLRGALALALALGLPESIPERETILKVTFAVVAFSVFVQTLTMTPLLQRLKVIKGKAGR